MNIRDLVDSDNRTSQIFSCWTMQWVVHIFQGLTHGVHTMFHFVKSLLKDIIDYYRLIDEIVDFFFQWF